MTRDVAVVLTGLDVIDLIMAKVRPSQPGRGVITESPVVTLMLGDGRVLEGTSVLEVLVDYTEEF